MQGVRSTADPSVLAVARRLVRFEPPEQALRDIDRCPPGIIDARSRAYWNLGIGRAQAPPLPVRRLPE
jgi:hypothetical protein